MQTFGSPEHRSQNPAGPELVERVTKLSDVVEKLYAGLLEQAKADGLDLPETEQRIITMWNDDTLPPVILGDNFRGSGCQFVIFHGDVPTTVFDWFYRNDDDFFKNSGVVLPSEDRPGSVSLIHNPEMGAPPTKPDPNDPSAFYAELVTLPSSPNSKNFTAAEVEAALKKLYTAMKMDTEQPTE